MEGTLEKLIVRPFGLRVWQARHVYLTGKAVEVESHESEVKVYPLLSFFVADTVAGVPKGKYGLAFLDEETGEVRLTLACATRFEHRRWVEAIRGAQNAARPPSRRRRTAVFSPPAALRKPLKEVQAPPQPKKRTHESFEVRLEVADLEFGEGVSLAAAATGSGLRVGDELVAVGDTCLFEDPEQIETGGACGASAADARRLIATASRPVVLAFRRAFDPRAAAEDAQLKQQQRNEEAVLPAGAQKFVKMSKVGVPMDAVLAKARVELDESDWAALRRALGVEAPPSTEPSSKPPVLQEEDTSKYERMCKLGAQPEAVLARAETEGLSERALGMLRAKLGVAAVAAKPTPTKAADYKGIHWQGMDESARRKRGSLWARHRNNKRESLGERAETLFKENKAAVELVDQLFSARKKKLEAVEEEKNSSTTTTTTTTRKRAESLRVADVELLDRQKALNLHITLKPLLKKRDPSDLVRDLVSRGQDVDVLKAVRAVLPAQDDLDKARREASDQRRYTAATLFALAAQPWGRRFPRVLDAWITLGEAERSANDAFAATSNAAVVCRALRTSRELRAVLHAALALGNQLNKGTKRSGAYGISLGELERLEHTKAHNGVSAITALAQILDLDTQNRGDDGLDAKAIDDALRGLVLLLENHATDANPDRTFEVADKLKLRLAAVKRVASLPTDDDDDHHHRWDPDDKRALDDFAAASIAVMDTLDAAKAALDANLLFLKRDTTDLLDYTNEAQTPLPVVLEALKRFAANLIAARERLTAKWWWQH
ncbi:hypothetical protein CTAYLR_009968 [Chrysophaeum taylorii]|uniref:Formin-like protein n=1 Tax=Chrysophaeum taylorii TaxID=2483200 RepID=A0AAD7XHS1_9STRA|nr:hypothetical protein CTAYLR_009968 [Chrysophaeum taylorii]